MIRSRTADPLARLSRAEKRAWRAAERRARKEHDTEQLAALLGLAASGGGVTGLRTPSEDEPLLGLATPVELIIEGRRVRAGRIHRPSLSKLKEGLSSIAAVPLTAVSRYGPYWVLTFRLAAEPLVVLAEHLTLLPDWGGPGGRELAPAGFGPFVGMGV